jgi:hypothetical protein
MSLITGSLVLKDPQALLWPRGIDWTDYLALLSANETVTDSAWSITGADAILPTTAGTTTGAACSCSAGMSITAAVRRPRTIGRRSRVGQRRKRARENGRNDEKQGNRIGPQCIGGRHYSARWVSGARTTRGGVAV